MSGQMTWLMSHLVQSYNRWWLLSGLTVLTICLAGEIWGYLVWERQPLGHLTHDIFPTRLQTAVGIANQDSPTGVHQAKHLQGHHMLVYISLHTAIPQCLYRESDPWLELGSLLFPLPYSVAWPRAVSHMIQHPFQACCPLCAQQKVPQLLLIV